MNYICEFKNNATGERKMVKLAKAGEAYVQKYQNMELDKLTRFTILNEIKMNYLADEIDLTKYTFHMVSEDMTQVV